MAETNRTPGTLKRTAMAAPYEDGLLELMMALLFLGIAALWGAGRGELLGILALPMIVGGGFALKRIKRTITEPRIGHVQGLNDDSAPAWKWFAFFGGGFALMFLAVGLTGNVGSSESWVQWMPLLSGYLIAGAFRYLAVTSGLRRYGILSLVSLVVGTTVAMASDGSSYSSMAIYFLIMSVIVAAFGIASLATFIARHPRLEPPASGNDSKTVR